SSHCLRLRMSLLQGTRVLVPGHLVIPGVDGFIERYKDLPDGTAERVQEDVHWFPLLPCSGATSGSGDSGCTGGSTCSASWVERPSSSASCTCWKMDQSVRS